MDGTNHWIATDWLSRPTLEEEKTDFSLTVKTNLYDLKNFINIALYFNTLFCLVHLFNFMKDLFEGKVCLKAVFYTGHQISPKIWFIAFFTIHDG